MALPFRLDATLYRGATFDLSFDWVGVDLTDCTAAMQIRDQSGAELLALATGGDGITITVTTTDAIPTSHVAVVATPTQTALVGGAVTDLGEYDLLVTYPSTRVDPVLRGAVTLVTAVTR